MALTLQSRRLSGRSCSVSPPACSTGGCMARRRAEDGQKTSTPMFSIGMVDVRHVTRAAKRMPRHTVGAWSATGCVHASGAVAPWCGRNTKGLRACIGCGENGVEANQSSHRGQGCLSPWLHDAVIARLCKEAGACSALVRHSWTRCFAASRAPPSQARMAAIRARLVPHSGATQTLLATSGRLPAPAGDGQP